MDLLAPCRSCLQCLPFFHVSPPSSPRLAAAAAPSSPYSQEASKATPTDPSQSSEKLSCSNAATAAQDQDLHLPSKEEEEPQDAKCDKDETAENFEDEHSTETESQEAPVSGIVIAPPVSASGGASIAEDVEDNKTTTLSELPMEIPFINDITFSASGFMPLPSPITPAPFGAGYPAGQYPPYHQIYQGQHQGHAHSHHEHENSHHGHEHSLHSHESSHVEHANSHHGHDHSHHGHANSLDGHDPQHNHVHAAPDYELPLPQPPSDDLQVSQELHKDASFHHSHHHHHDSLVVDDADNFVTGHVSLDDGHRPHDQIDDSFPAPLETSQSTPAAVELEAKVDGENSAVSHTNGASALLETYHSVPIVLFGSSHDDDNEAQDDVPGLSGSDPVPRRRRRDHFKDQFKGIRQQIKQGGHHIKEEGSKHMQTIIDNMNKQAQQIEQSGSFFMVPRANNN